MIFFYSGASKAPFWTIFYIRCSSWGCLLDFLLGKGKLVFFSGVKGILRLADLFIPPIPLELGLGKDHKT